MTTCNPKTTENYVFDNKGQLVGYTCDSCDVTQKDNVYPTCEPCLKLLNLESRIERLEELLPK